MLNSFKRSVYERFLAPWVRRHFFQDIITSTQNFNSLRWLGYPVWQNLFDLWTIQETLAEVKPELLIECGTNRGGSARYYAHLFDLMNHGSIISVDVEKLHELSHPRIEFLLGSSTDAAIFDRIRGRARACTGPVMVILDSDHSKAHVAGELELYPDLVTVGSYCLVQDGVIDVLPRFAEGRPGPLPAIEEFLAKTTKFEWDRARTERFPITHHPKGWLKRIR